MNSPPDPTIEFVDERQGYVDVCVGPGKMQLHDGRLMLEEDFRVDWEVWRVHEGVAVCERDLGSAVSPTNRRWKLDTA